MAEKAIKNKKPELLSPAGSIAALRAAVDGGADAVYFAMPEFNARINADNFTPESYAEGVELCHLSGVKAYITLNTQVYDRERSDFLKTAEKAYLSGADAAIVGDLGAARLLKKYLPELQLHASTQLSGHCVHAGVELSRLGFSRMVCAREMSLDDIKTFTEGSPIEAEIFIHGALCVCHSGQCLFSSLVGGRSGNRGLCAQPCRLPYKTPKGRNEYPLSLKDMSLAEHIPELLASGVASLKIEGRMKPADYVYRVTSVYRRLLDEGRNATESELRELADAFSRGGSFTDSYFTDRARGNMAKGMLGVRSEGDKGRSKESVALSREPRRTKISLSADIKRGEEMQLTLGIAPDEAWRFDGVGDKTVTVGGAVPTDAINRPATAESVLDSLLKLGGTPFVAEGGCIRLDDGLLIPHSALNAMRRDGVDALKKLICSPYTSRRPHNIDFAEEPPSSKEVLGKKTASKTTRVAIFYEPSSVTPEAAEYFDIIYLPLAAFGRSDGNLLYGGGVYGVMLPPVIFDSEMKRAEELINNAVKLNVGHVLVDNAGHLELARRSGMRLHGGLRLGISNCNTAESVRELGFEDMILSPELTLPRLRDISRRQEGAFAAVYGKMPLMITEKCLIRELSSCEECRRNRGTATLVDRTGAKFTVRREFDHRSLIFNSLPTYTADISHRLPETLDGHVYIFADESGEEVNEIIKAYVNRKPAANGRVRRI